MLDRDELVAAAREAALGAYVPYSNFRVGAAVLAVDGTVITSANVENAAYPVSQCAEANAVNYAVTQGHRRLPVVAVACIDAESIDSAYPCGRCRQIMSEFGVETIHVATNDGTINTHTMDELLPHRFLL
ncbi:MAG: cytidine deaminase [Acidimicrobiia bacterium]